jgi:allophanate hydrolase subunit 2
MQGRLRVLRAGPGATIQDGGRFGYLRYGGPWTDGVPTANFCLRHNDRVAAIEVTSGA